MAVAFRAHPSEGDGDGAIVTDWNSVFLEAVQIETAPPPLAARNLATQHVAMFDAVNAVPRTHHGYHHMAPHAANADPTAAAIGAGHQVSVALFPSRGGAFDRLLARHLAVIEASPAKNNELDLGPQCGEAVVALRAGDGSTTSVPYVPSVEPGRWRRSPPYFRPPELPQWRYVKPFALTNLASFRPPPPPALDSERWAADLQEAQSLGGKESKTRTIEQTEIARFWSDFSYTMTPPRHWNEVARSVALEKQLSLEVAARLFALLNIAMADAAIVCWDAKYEYDFWRPVTATQEAQRDGNPATAPDPGWEPLLPTPSHPQYPSGHCLRKRDKSSSDPAD